MKFSYTNDLKELKQLATDITNFSKENQIKDEVVYALNLCLDEVLTNIISYGLKNTPKGEEKISLELTIHDGKVIATISDNGSPFDPLTEGPKNPDISSELENRKIGGLGVYFLDQYMDSVNYRRENDHNVLTLTKDI